MLAVVSPDRLAPSLRPREPPEHVIERSVDALKRHAVDGHGPLRPRHAPAHAVAAVQRHLHRSRRPSHCRLEHLQVLKIAFSLRSFLRFAELETCFTEQLLPEEPVGVNNVTELMSNQSMNMTNLTSLTTNQGANLTSLVVMVPRVCPTALRKSHWYTRYEFLHIPFSLCFTLSNS